MMAIFNKYFDKQDVMALVKNDIQDEVRGKHCSSRSGRFILD
jgi:hypothetical protein